jgi:uncharacterized membrane protein HdeD (DUF308 family)
MLKKLNKLIYTSIIISLIFIVIGIILIVYPTISFSILSYILAVLFIAHGITLLIEDRGFFPLFMGNYLFGIMSFVIGIILILHPIALKVFIPMCLGIWFIVNGLVKMRLTTYLRKENIGSYILSITMSIITLICGVLLLVNPIDSMDAITVAMGIILVVYSISDILDMLVFKKYINGIVKNIKSTYQEIKSLF